MQQPWDEPAEPLGQAAENLPLAGLLAELLAGAEAANEGAPAPGPEDGEGCAPVAAEAWFAEPASGHADVSLMMRALGEAELERQEAAAGDVSSQLLSRLMEDALPAPPAGLAGMPPEEAPPALPPLGLEAVSGDERHATPVDALWEQPDAENLPEPARPPAVPSEPARIRLEVPASAAAAGVPPLDGEAAVPEEPAPPLLALEAALREEPGRLPETGVWMEAGREGGKLGPESSDGRSGEGGEGAEEPACGVDAGPLLAEGLPAVAAEPAPELLMPDAPPQAEWSGAPEAGLSMEPGREGGKLGPESSDGRNGEGGDTAEEPASGGAAGPLLAENIQTSLQVPRWEAGPAGTAAYRASVPDEPAEAECASGAEPSWPCPPSPVQTEDGPVLAGTSAAVEPSGAELSAEQGWKACKAAGSGAQAEEAALEIAAPERREAGGELPAPQAADPRPGLPAPVLPSSEEDEFELVDAETAGKMLDQLIDAARTAIRSSLAPSAPAAAPAEPAGRAPEKASDSVPAGEPSAGAPSSSTSSDAGVAGAGNAVRPLRPARPTPAAAEEELGQEPPPLPPAAALIGMGLPERLRARLESLGDVERVLAAHSESAPGRVVDQRRRLLVFRVGDGYYGLPIENVREVERVARLTPVPGAPRFVRGLVNLRGEILPLVDMRLLLGAGGAELPPSPRLIVAQADRQEPPLALMVEELNGLAPVEEEQSSAAAPGPGGTLPAWMRGSLEHRGRRVWRLDPAALLSLAALEERAELR